MICDNLNHHKNLRSDLMARIICIDYGLKRTGLAVTDPLQIIATGLTTVHSKELISFLKNYFQKEPVELIIIGEPKNWDDSDTHATPLVEQCIKDLQKNFPATPIKKVDERFTAKMAKDAMLEMGMKKKDRRKKELVDEIAATIMLQEYLRANS
jgi:putative holliday junction resolvase